MITPGTILMDKEAPHPPCFHLEEDALPNAWMSVKHDLSPQDLEQELAAAGWTFIFRANSIRTTAIGFNRPRMMHTATKHLIARAVQQGCNALEIEEVASHSFLGVPYVNVSAHPRQIQKGMVFAGRQHRKAAE